jgi:hypothetical protein
MGHNHQARTGIGQLNQARHRSVNAGGIGYDAIFHRNIKVGTQQHALACDRNTVKRIEISHYQNLPLRLTSPGGAMKPCPKTGNSRQNSGAIIGNLFWPIRKPGASPKRKPDQ